MNEAAARQLLSRLLDWEDAHIGFEAAVAGIPVELRGKQPEGAPYSPWQLLEHLRMAQHDILDFCVNPDYEEQKWPEDYWPRTAAPPSDRAWEESIERYRRDRKALQNLAVDPNIELTARIPHAADHTYLRELVLVADHSAYHLGQLVLVRRLLGIWNPK
jgi:DinB superfamily